jgi:hypothetical protein
MTSPIETPYVAHIVADIDDNEDPAPAAWLSAVPRRRFTSNEDVSQFGWLAVAKRAW